MSQHTSHYDNSTHETLAARFPHTVAAFDAMGALDHLDRIAQLDAIWDEIRQPTTDDRQETRDKRQETRDKRQETRDKRQETRDKRQEITDNGQQTTVYEQRNSRLKTQNSKLNVDFDLIYAGGGLGLLHAVVMAQRYGYHVLLFDRGEVGCAHREWNISRAELAQLVASGFCAWGELADVIMAEYERGVVRFYAAQGQANELWMHDVLNIALDANALLRLARRKLEAAGGVVLDQRVFQRVVVGESRPLWVEVELGRLDGAVERYSGRLLLDGMGSGSPLALRRFGGQPFAGVCPTVGTVATGFAMGQARDEHDPRVGDILISVADAQRGQQYMWEGFPGRGDELTVYLFYYDTLTNDHGPQTTDHRPRTTDHGLEQDSDHRSSVVSRRSSVVGRQSSVVSRQSSVVGRRSSVNLMQLFEDYFALLPTYKRPGPGFRHLKPVYGYIPARHSVRRQEAPLLRGVLPIGDSAAQQSPLTFCGFGSHVRNLDRGTALLHAALCHDLLEPKHLRWISPYQVNVSLNWVFSRFMQPWRAPRDVNELQNIFLAVLNDLGEDLARRFFRDQMRWGDYHRMILGMFRRHPRIVLIAWRVLGPAGVHRWVGDYLTYSGVALRASVGRRLGVGGRLALVRLGERLSPALGLRLRASFAEWRAMGWLEEQRTEDRR